MEGFAGARWRWGVLSCRSRGPGLGPSQPVCSFSASLTLGLTPVTSFWFVLALIRELGSEFGSLHKAQGSNLPSCGDVLA